MSDLISREALKKALHDRYAHWGELSKYKISMSSMFETLNNLINNAPTVEVPENAVNCVLTMFGECSYNETGCHDCEIKNKIRKALSQRPQDEWICPNCDLYEQAENNYCQYAGRCTIACHKCKYFKRKGGSV